MHPPGEGLDVGLWIAPGLLALTFVSGGLRKVATPVPELTSKMPGPSSNKDWPIGAIRSFLSVPLRVHKLGATVGSQPGQPVFTVRVRASAKASIRKRLSELFGYSYSVLFPDYPGFATFGAGHALRSVK
jgi:hypothetical protein